MQLERVAPEPTPIGQACRSLLLAFVAAEPCPVERAAMLEIMRKDGLL